MENVDEWEKAFLELISTQPLAFEEAIMQAKWHVVEKEELFTKGMNSFNNEWTFQPSESLDSFRSLEYWMAERPEGIMKKEEEWPSLGSLWTGLHFLAGASGAPEGLLLFLFELRDS